RGERAAAPEHRATVAAAHPRARALRALPGWRDSRAAEEGGPGLDRLQPRRSEADQAHPARSCLRSHIPTEQARAPADPPLAPAVEPLRLLCGGEERHDRLDDPAGGFRQQVRLDEAVEIPVEHALRVSDLVLGAVVLDQLVRVQDVAPDRVAAEA